LATAPADSASGAGGATPVAAAQRPGIYSWYVLGLLVCIYGANWMDRYVLVILLEPIKRDLGLSDGELGLLTGFAFAAVYSLAGIPIARLADRRARRPVIALGLAFWSAMTLASGFARSFVHLLFARFGVALGESACSPAAHSLICDFFPQRQRATAFALYGLGISFGISAGLILGGWANELYGWRAAFWIVGAPGLILCALVMLTLREPVRGGAESGPADTTHYTMPQVLRFMSTRRSFIGIALGLGLITLGGNAFETWTPVYLMRAYGMTSGMAGTWSGLIYGGAGIIGTLAGGVIADRLGARDLRWYLWLPMWAAALMIPSMLLFLYVGGRAMFFFYFLTTLCSSAYMAPMIAAAQRLMPARMRALASAVLFLALNFIGPGAGPLLAGILNDVFAPTFGDFAIRYSLTVTQLGPIAGILATAYAARRLLGDIAMSDGRTA
jgi:predicted MFS family arabinose efflux permease